MGIIRKASATVVAGFAVLAASVVLDLSRVAPVDEDLRGTANGWFGAVSAAPEAWLQALNPGGRLAVVLRTGPVGKATVFLRTEGAVSAREAFDSTPSWLPGFEPKAAFVF